MIADKDKSKKGFSGLVNLVSDISIVENINDYELKGFAPRKSSSEYEVVNSYDNRKKQKEFNPLLWGLGVTMIIIYLIWINNSVQTDKNSSSVRAPSPPISQRSNPTPVNTAKTAPTNNSNAQHKYSFEEFLEPIGATTPINNSNAQLQYEKPPVGTDNTFNISQLRWYFRENIRLEVIRYLVDTDDAIDAFNRLIEDYNSRCASFRYRESDFRRAEREVEARRSEITREATLEAILLNYNSKPQKQTPQIGYITGNKVFLRPDVSKREGPFLMRNNKVTIIQDAAKTYDNKTWSYVDYNGRKGYVSKEYISEKPVP